MGQLALLDTHTLIWGLMKPHKLSPKSRATLTDPDSLLHVSSACAWELSFKHKLGKLTVLTDFPSHLKQLQA